MKMKDFEEKKGSRVYTSGMRTLVVIVERSKEARKRLSLFSHTLSSCREKVKWMMMKKKFESLAAQKIIHTCTQTELKLYSHFPIWIIYRKVSIFTT